MDDCCVHFLFTTIAFGCCDLDFRTHAEFGKVFESGTFVRRSTRIWAFAHLLSGAVIGENCSICDYTFIEGGVRIGNRVTVKCGIFLWDGMIIEDDVFIGPAAGFTNDQRPRSKRYPERYLPTILRKGCTLGTNCTLLPDLSIGQRAMLGIGSVVTHSVSDYALVVGNPARFRGWVCRCGKKLAPEHNGLAVCPSGLCYRQIAEHQLIERPIGAPILRTLRPLMFVG